MKKIGILGGTFNPIHNGHIAIAREAYHYLQLDKIIFIPSGVSYLKTGVLPAKDRYEMVREAIQDYSFFDISDIEIKRAGNSYTYETLQELHQTNPNDRFYFILGADSLYSIQTWKEPEIIFELCTIVCAVRDDVSKSQLQQKADMLHEDFGAEVILLPMDHIDISSTEIRKFIYRDESISDQIPLSVFDYIKEHQLYK